MLTAPVAAHLLQGQAFKSIVENFAESSSYIRMVPNPALYHGFAQVPFPFYSCLKQVLSIFEKNWQSMSAHYKDEACALHMVGMQNFCMPLTVIQGPEIGKHHFCISLHFHRINSQNEKISFIDINGYPSDLHTIAIDCTQGVVVYPEAILELCLKKNKTGHYREEAILGKLDTFELGMYWNQVLWNPRIPKFFDKYAPPANFKRFVNVEDTKGDATPIQSSSTSTDARDSKLVPAEVAKDKETITFVSRFNRP